MMRIGIAADHGGFELKAQLTAALKADGYEVADFGAHELVIEDDYPDFVVPLASETGGYCGTLDPDLTPTGYQMAEDFADAYQSLPWVAVISSPLGRAVATAKPLCEATGLRMQLKEGLREIAYGQWEGKIPE
jgi:hypothetical protein